MDFQDTLYWIVFSQLVLHDMNLHPMLVIKNLHPMLEWITVQDNETFKELLEYIPRNNYFLIGRQADSFL